MKPTRQSGQPSWQFSSDKVEAAVTQTGGHLAPVRFCLPGGIVEPFSVAPWAEEAQGPGVPRMLHALRGDFFCMPFGGNATPYRGEAHPAHGETADNPWHFESLEKDATGSTLHLSLDTKTRPGRVEKFLSLRNGETAIYSRHRLSGMSGPMNLGHHAMLRFPDEPGSGLISTSRIQYGQVAPEPFEVPAQRGYQSLKTAARFSRLDRVPSVFGGTADVSRYPARRGFEDLVMMVHEDRPDFAWTAVTFPKQGYVWFALKDPRVLRSTILWISNGGRHYAPWNGRHVNVMGLEEVTSYFHYGLAESARPNPVSKEGYPTTLSLRKSKPLEVNYIMAVAPVPKGFDKVKKIIPGASEVRLVSESKHEIRTPVDAAFLYGDR